MATSFYFGGRKRTLPGVYSEIKSGIKNLPLALDYGKVLIIDTGSGAGFGGGSGINGELASKDDAVYFFSNTSDFQSFVKGSILYKTGEALFKPDKVNLGASYVYYVRAATTTAATMTFTAVGGGSNGGAFKLKTRDEGVIGNGILTDASLYGDGAIGEDAIYDDLDAPVVGHLFKGYAYTVETGVYDTNKWILKCWVGTWTGYHTDDISFNEITKVGSTPTLLCQSPEFSNMSELIAWGQTDKTLDQFFYYDPTSAIAGDGTIDLTDVTNVAGYNVATGGTESYATTDLDDVFEVLNEWDGSFILIDKYGTTDYDNTYVTKIQTFIETDAKYDIIAFYGAGADSTEFSSTDGSIDIAAYFDSEKMVAVHGDVYQPSILTTSGIRRWPTIYTAALTLGRLAGKAPQVPLTFKSIDVKKLAHNPSNREKELALQSGVLMIYNDPDFGKFTVLQGVNTLQKNQYLLNPDGKTFSIQLVRIKAQLNKELTINSKSQLLSTESGVNRNTLSPNYLKDWTERYLQSRVSNERQDNLLVVGDNGEPAWEEVTVTRDQDAYFITYKARANSEITKLFFTGFFI